MFRRILSPRQPPQEGKSTRGHPPPPETVRSQSTGALQLNGHGNEEVIDETTGDVEVKNFGYGDPDTFTPVRSQSLITTPTREMSNPPLPPRNARPSSFGHSGRQQGEPEADSAVYVAPADTLKGKIAGSSHPSSASQPPVNMDPAVGPEQLHATRSERRQMQMHQLTMQQRKGQSQSVSSGSAAAPGTTSKPSNGHGHNRTRSFGNVADNSDYSVPFNLVNDNRVSRPPPMKPPRIGLQASRHDNTSDRIIAINPPATSPQPPSDRSDTTSPSSPLSNQSSEHEPPRQEDGNSDYAVPWDRNKLLRNVRKPPGIRRTEDSGFEDSGGTTHSTAPSHRPSRGTEKENVQLMHQHMRNEPFSASMKDHEPPPPLRGAARFQSAREPIMSYHASGVGVENSPPPPELPFDPERPHRNRMPSNRAHRSDGSTSPVPVALDHHHQLIPGHPPPPPHSVRYTAAPHGHPPAERPPFDRPLPDNPIERPLPPPRDYSVSRDRDSVIIDVSIPLEDQPWYHGHVTRAEAERILRDQPDFSFLVRKSESCETDYSLSIRDTSSASGGYYHLRLVFEEDPTPGYVLGQFSSHYEKVTECIANYTKQRLNIRGAEHKRLRYPIPRTQPMERGHITTVGV